MAHAAMLACKARGATAPNPIVGCVVVRDGRIVGEGFHARAGEPHAEVIALADAGGEARGADLYVTLEPCSHFGRTPPCTQAILEAGVGRVHVGMRDPSTEARGGAEILSEAGVRVDFAEDPSPFIDLNRGWLKRVSTGLPYVTAKLALSLDGRPALESGRPASITGRSGARVTRSLRARTDAVLVGAATVSCDDPALTVRDERGDMAERQPTRVVLVRGAMPPSDARVFTDGAAPTVVLLPDAGGLDDDVAGAAHVVVERYPVAQGLRGALRVLGRLGINDVLIEPGPRLFEALWSGGVIDTLVSVTAGGLAGCGAPGLFAGEACRDGDTLAHVMRPVESTIVGDVCVSVWEQADE